MKNSLAFCFAVFAPVAGAYVYPLQFTPNAGYRGLVVAGYGFNGNTVVGNCSYYTVRSGSGRGGGYHTTTMAYNQTCAWDLFGNLLSVTPGALAAPDPLYVSGTQTVYAVNASGDSTGTDTTVAHGGFVNTPGSHYSWLTPNAYMVLQQARYTFSATLLSDGQFPLQVAAVQASALRGAAGVSSTTCNGEIASGATCSVNVTYDPSKLCSATDLAYDTLDIALTTDAGQAHDFTQGYTIAVKRCDD